MAREYPVWLFRGTVTSLPVVTGTTAIIPSLLLLLLRIVPELPAHTPHDATVWVATAIDESGVATGIEREDRWHVFLSDDEGERFSGWVFGGTRSPLHDGIWLDDASLAVATEGEGVRQSPDGRNWTATPGIPVNADVRRFMRLADDTLVAAGEAVWRCASDCTHWEEVFSPPDTVVALGTDPSGSEICLSTIEGWIACSQDHAVSWSQRASAATLATDLTLGDDGAIYLATAGRGLEVLEPSAERFSALPVGESSQFGAVASFEGGLLLAAEYDGSVWRSTDGGASFSSASEGIEEPTSGAGNRPDGRHAFRFAGRGDAIYLATWEGLHRSDDCGESWRQLPVLSPQVHWRASLTPNGTDAPQVVMPSYGGAALRMASSEDGFVSFPASNTPPCCLRGTAASDAFDTDGVLWVPEKGNLWVTTNAGEDWLEITETSALDYVETVALQPETAQPLAFVGGQYGESLDLAVSRDGGVTFERPGIAATVEGSTVHALAVTLDGDLYAAVSGPTLLYSDGESAFQVLGNLSEIPFDLVSAPDGTLWATSPSGLWSGVPAVGAPNAGLRTVAFADEMVSAMALSPDWPVDATLWVALRDRIEVSRDGGETFSPLPWRPPSTPLAIALSPDFPEDGTVAVASTAGVWLSRDCGKTWILASNQLRIGPGWHEWDLDETWTLVESESAWLKTFAQARSTGAEARFRFYGDGIALRAFTGAGEGAVEVWVDDNPAQSVSLQGDSAFDIVFCESLALGHHTLGLRTQILPVKIESAQILISGGLTPDLCAVSVTAPSDPASCSCASFPIPSPNRALICTGLIFWRRRR